MQISYSAGVGEKGRHFIKKNFMLELNNILVIIYNLLPSLMWCCTYRKAKEISSLPEQCSQRSGGPGSPTGKLPRRLDRAGRQFLLRLVGHFRTAGLSKDHGPHKVRHYYAIPINGPQGTVVDCRSPDKDGGDL